MVSRERIGLALVLGSLAFFVDWAGYDRLNPSLFHPKAVTQVWWHLPLWLGVSFIVTLLWRSR
jgi:hypothetical protein